MCTSSDKILWMINFCHRTATRHIYRFRILCPDYDHESRLLCPHVFEVCAVSSVLRLEAGGNCTCGHYGHMLGSYIQFADKGVSRIFHWGTTEGTKAESGG